MKQICIGDTHGHYTWEKILEKHPDFDRFIFIGDYVDSFSVTGLEQVENLRKIIKFKEESVKNGKQVILLIGNHDFHYFPEIGYNGCSGYQPAMSKSFEFEFNEYRKLFQMAFVDENRNVFTHAGITKSFLKLQGIPHTLELKEIVNRINDLFIYTPKVFSYNPADRGGYGDHIFQSPIWVRPNSLYRDAIDYMQIVGHTGQPSINPRKSGRQGYYLIDTLGTSGEFLVINDGEITIDKL